MYWFMLSMDLLIIKGNLCDTGINIISSYTSYIITAVLEVKFQVFQGLRNIKRDTVIS